LRFVSTFLVLIFIGRNFVYGSEFTRATTLSLEKCRDRLGGTNTSGSSSEENPNYDRMFKKISNSIPPQFISRVTITRGLNSISFNPQGLPSNVEVISPGPNLITVATLYLKNGEVVRVRYKSQKPGGGGYALAATPNRETLIFYRSLVKDVVESFAVNIPAIRLLRVSQVISNEGRSVAPELYIENHPPVRRKNPKLHRF